MAVAFDACYAVDFAVVDVEGEVVDWLGAVVVGDGEVVELEPGCAGCVGGGGDAEEHWSADHHFGEFGFGDGGGGQGAGDGSFAHDGDGVGDAEDFVEFVGDEDDGVVALPETVEGGKELVGFGGGEDGGGFVEDHD